MERLCVEQQIAQGLRDFLLTALAPAPLPIGVATSRDAYKLLIFCQAQDSMGGATDALPVLVTVSAPEEVDESQVMQMEPIELTPVVSANIPAPAARSTRLAWA